MPSRRKRLQFSLVLGVLLLVTFLGLVELIIPLTSIKPMLDMQNRARRQVLTIATAKRLPALVRDRRRPGDPPGEVFTTKWKAGIELRYRPSRVVRPKPPNTFRVFLLGNSIAWGLIHEVEEHASIWLSAGWFLQQKLSILLHPRRVEVVNLARPGSVAEEVLRRVEEVLAFQPDALVMIFGINDFNGELMLSTYDPDRHQKGWLRRHLLFIDTIAWLLWPYQVPQVAGMKVMLMHRLLQALSLAGPRMPVIYVGPFSDQAGDWREINAVLRQAFAGAGGIYIDAEAGFAREARKLGVPYDHLLSDVCHPTTEGYRMLADMVIEAMRRHGVLNASPTAANEREAVSP